MVSLRTKILVHGNAVFLQFPGGGGFGGLQSTAGHSMSQFDHHALTDLLGERQGPGVVFRGNSGNTNFFHVSIPSPDRALVRSETLISDAMGIEPTHFYTTVSALLINVFFEVSLDPGVVIDSVFVFDGRNMLPGFPLPPTPTSFGPTVVVVPSAQPIQSGLGISFGVTFNAVGNIVFHSAGAEFQYSNLP